MDTSSVSDALTWSDAMYSPASIYQPPQLQNGEESKETVHLSNFYVRESGLFVLDGQIWSSVVQYYYANKLAFDNVLVERIKKMHDPKKIIELFGNQCPRNKISQWYRISNPILKRGMYAKIEQNIEFFLELMNTPDQKICRIEDNPFEQDTSKFLFKIRKFYKDKKHPLDEFKKGDLKPHIARMFEGYRRPIEQ
jgi:predicted NAD-dependent protein-ADP-ribosyltransferase YbiA (DUF1768 family)